MFFADTECVLCGKFIEANILLTFIIMKIFVINLPEDTDRLKAIENQLQTLGLSYDVFTAIRGSSLSSAEISESYDEKWFVRNEGRAAALGELGCAMSHIAIYRIILERKIPHALVLEDDAWLNPNLPQLLEYIAKKFKADQKNVFLLTWYKAISRSGIERIWSSYHLAPIESAYCTHGYVLSYAAAAAMCKELAPVRHVADCWIWLRRHRVVNIRAIFPTCITADLSYKSGVSLEIKQNPLRHSFYIMRMHKIYRAFWLAYDHTFAFLKRIRFLIN